MSAAQTFEFKNYVERQPGLPAALVIRPQALPEQPPAKKPSRSTRERNALWEPMHAEGVPSSGTSLRGLDDTYVVENRSMVVRFIEENRLLGMLLQAIKPLNTHFGERSIKMLSILSDDEGSETLFCLVATTGGLQQNRQALRAFDEDWWLSRAKQAAGALNFDFILMI